MAAGVAAGCPTQLQDASQRPSEKISKYWIRISVEIQWTCWYPLIVDLGIKQLRHNQYLAFRQLGQILILPDQILVSYVTTSISSSICSMLKCLLLTVSGYSLCWLNFEHIGSGHVTTLVKRNISDNHLAPTDNGWQVNIELTPD